MHSEVKQKDQLTNYVCFKCYQKILRSDLFTMKTLGRRKRIVYYHRDCYERMS